VAVAVVDGFSGTEHLDPLRSISNSILASVLVSAIAHQISGLGQLRYGIRLSHAIRALAFRIDSQRRTVEGNLLRDHSTERETKHIDLCEANGIRERKCVLRPHRHAFGDLAGRPPQTGVLEQDYVTPQSEGICHCGVPIIRWIQ
jgi:hypothetical protein